MSAITTGRMNELSSAVIEGAEAAVEHEQTHQRRQAADHRHRHVKYVAQIAHNLLGLSVGLLISILINRGKNHAYISGTASINNKGEVMHIGNIEKQTQRMWENVETLLQEANMTMADTAQIIVYLRDNADYNTVSQMFRQKYPHVPTVFTLAPVCRPTWLIEMECIAIRTATNNTFNNF